MVLQAAEAKSIENEAITSMETQISELQEENRQLKGYYTIYI